MKFLETHRQDIISAFKNNNREKTEFSFIKRKGRIITQHNQDKRTFSYIMKEETAVNEKSREWVSQTFFLMKINEDKEVRIESWTDVLVSLNLWLKSL